MSPLAEGLRSHLSAEALERLKNARVGIAGAGGLGSNVAMLLTRSGVGHLVLADGDRVESSNLNRQFYWPEDVGTDKVFALRARLLGLEPGLDCVIRKEWLTAPSSCALFAGCDVVVEALDKAEQKAALCGALLQGGFYVVAASGLGGLGGPEAEPMTARRLGPSFVCVGDFASGVDADHPPLGPRVMQAAALQADMALARLLRPEEA